MYDRIERFCTEQRILLDYSNEGPGVDLAPGPAGGGCDIIDRIVWSDDLLPHETLHEIMHVYLAVPFLPMRMQPEEHLLLIPIERQLAEVLLEPRDFAACVRWQNETPVSKRDGGECAYEDLPRSEKASVRMRALTFGITLGVLDRSLRPTFATPDWNRLTLKQRSALCHGIDQCLKQADRRT